MPTEGAMNLTETEAMELRQQANSRTLRAESARHARLILLLADRLTWAEIRAKLDCSDSYIDRWSKRFAADRLGGLFTRHVGRKRYKVTDRMEARVLARTTRHKPADGSTHWSTRNQAAPARGLPRLQRPGLRGQGGRCDRAVPPSAAACCCVQR